MKPVYFAFLALRVSVNMKLEPEVRARSYPLFYLVGYEKGNLKTSLFCFFGRNSSMTSLPITVHKTKTLGFLK